MDEAYYVPLTLNEFLNGIRTMVSSGNNDLNGEELITDVVYVGDNTREVPPGSITLFLRRNTLDPDDPKFGTLILTPSKARILM